jgi:hypothetical protein
MSDGDHISTAFYLGYLYCKQSYPCLPLWALPQQNLANQATDLPRAIAENLEKSLNQVCDFTMLST